jgi:hypothetical protein
LLHAGTRFEWIAAHLCTAPWWRVVQRMCESASCQRRRDAQPALKHLDARWRIA